MCPDIIEEAVLYWKLEPSLCQVCGDGRRKAALEVARKPKCRDSRRSRRTDSTSKKGILQLLEMH